MLVWTVVRKCLRIFWSYVHACIPYVCQGISHLLNIFHLLYRNFCVTIFLFNENNSTDLMRFMYLPIFLVLVGFMAGSQNAVQVDFKYYTLQAKLFGFLLQY